jgi:hypothetical protein
MTHEREKFVNTMTKAAANIDRGLHNTGDKYERRELRRRLNVVLFDRDMLRAEIELKDNCQPVYARQDRHESSLVEEHLRRAAMFLDNLEKYNSRRRQDQDGHLQGLRRMWEILSEQVHNWKEA